MHFIKTFFFITIYLLLSTTNVSAQNITDKAGRTIQIDKPYSRIITLYGAHTENLFSLGLDTEIIGVSKNDDFPEQVQSKARFHYREDPEKFIAANPDLVLIRPMIDRAYPDLIAKLNMAGITVVSLQPTSIDETFSYWRTLGQLTGRIKEAESMVTHFNQELEAIKTIVQEIPQESRKKVYFESIHRKMKTFTASSMAMFSLTSAGGINIATDAKTVRSTNIAAYSKERILAKADKIDIFLAQQGKMNKVTTKTIYQEPGFQVIKAVQNKEVYLVEEPLVSRPTLRLLTGINKIGSILYPDKFTDL